MKNIDKKSPRQLIIGIFVIAALIIVSIVLYNETSLLLTGIAIILFAILFKIFFVNRIDKK